MDIYGYYTDRENNSALLIDHYMNGLDPYYFHGQLQLEQYSAFI